MVDLDQCPHCEERSSEMDDHAPWWVCGNRRCPVVHFNNG